MLNILYILQSNVIGGAEISLINIIQRLNPKKLNPVILLDSKSKVAAYLGNKMLRTEILPWGDKYGPYKRDFIRLVKKHKIQIIHTNTPRNFRAAILAKSVKIPHLWHIHTNLGSIYPDLDKKRIREALSLIYISSAKVITASKWLKEQFAFINRNEDKLQTIYNGIDIDYYNEITPLDFRLVYKINRSDFVVGMFSRFDPLKRQEDFIRSAVYIKRNIRNAKFILAGDNNSVYFRNNLMGLIRDNRLEKDFVFPGYLKDIRPALNATDVVVLPSVTEGLPLILLEAMAAGRPVVASDIAGNREVVAHQKSGLLVEPKKPYELAAAIDFFFKNPQKRQQLADAARKQVMGVFDIKNTVRHFEDLYSRIIHYA